MQDGSRRVYEGRAVFSPLTDEMVRPIEARHASIDLTTPLTDDEYRRVANLMEQYPQTVLTTLPPYQHQVTDLEFLRFFPFLRRFVVHFRALESLDGLRHLSDSLEGLGVLWAKRQLDLSVLRQLKRLRVLEIESHKRHIEVLSEMTWLEDLTLRSITLPDLSLLLPPKDCFRLTSNWEGPGTFLCCRASESCATSSSGWSGARHVGRWASCPNCVTCSCRRSRTSRRFRI